MWEAEPVAADSGVHERPRQKDFERGSCPGGQRGGPLVPQRSGSPRGAPCGRGERPGRCWGAGKQAAGRSAGERGWSVEAGPGRRVRKQDPASSAKRPRPFPRSPWRDTDDHVCVLDGSSGCGVRVGLSGEPAGGWGQPGVRGQCGGVHAGHSSKGQGGRVHSEVFSRI